MARVYRFYARWVCLMGSYVWGIQVFCSRKEVAAHFSNRTERLNTSGITSYGTDSFRVKQIIPGHPIPKTSNRLTIFWGVPERQCLWKQSTDKRGQQRRNQMDSIKKCLIELWKILMFELLLCCHTAVRCMKRTQH